MSRFIYYEPKEDFRDPVKRVFEINTVGIGGESLSGCPICPLCKEPAYENSHCVFCGVKFEKGID